MRFMQHYSTKHIMELQELEENEKGIKSIINNKNNKRKAENTLHLGRDMYTQVYETYRSPN